MVAKNRSQPKTGRFPSLTPLVFKALVEATTNGLPRKAAAQCAGVAHSTLMKYLAAGRNHKDRLPPAIFKKWMDGDHILTQSQRLNVQVDLFHALQRGRGQAVKRNVEVIQAAAMGRQVVERRTIKHQDGTSEVFEKFAPAAWTAAAWWLERSEPNDFGRKDKTETTLRTEKGNSRGAAILIVDGPEKIEPPAE